MIITDRLCCEPTICWSFRWFICDPHNDTQALQSLLATSTQDETPSQSRKENALGCWPHKGKNGNSQSDLSDSSTPAIPYWLQMCLAQGSFNVSSLLSNLGKVQGGWRF